LDDSSKSENSFLNKFSASPYKALLLFSISIFELSSDVFLSKFT